MLEIGLGTGTDFVQWVRAGAEAYGRDLTQASVELTTERVSFEPNAANANVAMGDAEALDFPDDYFDIYYSWGVAAPHANTEKAFAEAWRVLKPGGSFRIMLYNYHSVSALLIWLAQGPLRGRMVGIRGAYTAVESPGTQLFSRKQARDLAAKFFKPESIEVKTYLGSGDLLNHRLSSVRLAVWRFVQAVYPAWLVKLIGDGVGTELTLSAIK